MKKYKCIGCGMSCWLQVDDDNLNPFWCVCNKKFDADWHEINVEAIEISNPEKALPDWVQECAIGYDNEQERYFEVTNVSEKWVDIEYLDDGIGATCDYSDIQKCSEAKKRPFNDKEMKALVGKVIQDKLGNRNLVNKYLIIYNEIIVFNAYYTPQKLLESDFTINGKPCYVLEHLNDKGEWVE